MKIVASRLCNFCVVLLLALLATSARAVDIDPPQGYLRVSDMEGGSLTMAYSRELGSGHELYLIVEMDLSEELIRDVCPPEAIECINAVLRPFWAAISAMKTNIASRPPWTIFPDELVARVKREPGERRFEPRGDCASERWRLDIEYSDGLEFARGVTVRCRFHKEFQGGPWLTQASMIELRGKTVRAMPTGEFENLAARALSSLRR